MRILRLSALLAAGLTLVACGAVGRMFQAGGRTLHLNSETRKAPDDFKLESRDVHDALAQGAELHVKLGDSRSEVALR